MQVGRLATAACAVVLAVLAVAAPAGGRPAAAGEAGEILRQRSLAMKGLRFATAMVGRMVDGRIPFDRPMADEILQGMIADLDGLPETFSDGGSAAPSDAKEEIWTDWAGFLAARDVAAQAAGRLLAAIREAVDADGVRAEFRAVEAACDGCHDRFRK